MKDQRPSKRTRRMQTKEIRGKDEGKGEKWTLTRISSKFDGYSLDEDGKREVWWDLFQSFHPQELG